MAGIEALVRAYEHFVSLPWDQTLAGPERVWFAVYSPFEERRLRARIGEFENATKKAGHGWHYCDLTDLFAQWMAAHEYRESYFAAPQDLALALDEFAERVKETVGEALSATGGDRNTVVAISGIASLYGLIRVSDLLQSVSPQVTGRLLVFFPGERDGANYRLLDARDGWNYLAIPITAQEG